MAEKKYTVMVDDNFHYMDESERYKLNDFGTCEEATEACKRIVDEFLLGGHKPGISSDELWKQYTMFGEDPFIVTSDESCKFSAWDYAKERIKELTGQKE